MKTRKETIHHPQHYNMGKYEVIMVIENWKLGFHLGNTVKYIGRCGYKDNPIEDLKKAQWYLKKKCNKLKVSANKYFISSNLKRLISSDIVSTDWKLSYNLSRVLFYIRLIQTNATTKSRTLFFFNQALAWLDREIKILEKRLVLPKVISKEKARKIGINLIARSQRKIK